MNPPSTPVSKPQPPPIYTPTDDPPEGAFCCAYTGESMAPLFRRADLLEVVPYDTKPIRRGDVVFARAPKGVSERFIVHRVTSFRDQLIITRGDNTSACDPSLPRSAIVGRVTARWRDGCRADVAGGPHGWATAFVCRAAGLLLRIVRPLLRPLTSFIVRHRLAVQLLPQSLRPRVVAFQSGGKETFRLLMGRRTIGYYALDLGQWFIRHPYSLFVDHTILLKFSKEHRR